MSAKVAFYRKIRESLWANPEGNPAAGSVKQPSDMKLAKRRGARCPPPVDTDLANQMIITDGPSVDSRWSPKGEDTCGRFSSQAEWKFLPSITAPEAPAAEREGIAHPPASKEYYPPFNGHKGCSFTPPPAKPTKWAMLANSNLDKYVFGGRFHHYVERDQFERLLPDPWSLRMSSFDLRFQSYGEYWPKQMAQSPVDLSLAGFFYTGEGDRVKTFCCGLTLSQWNHYDIPWDKHKQARPKCNLAIIARK